MAVILINLLLLLVVALVVFLVARYILDQMEADPPIRKIVLLILGLLFLIWIVNIFTGHAFFGPVIVV